MTNDTNTWVYSDTAAPHRRKKKQQLQHIRTAFTSQKTTKQKKKKMLTCRQTNLVENERQI